MNKQYIKNIRIAKVIYDYLLENKIFGNKKAIPTRLGERVELELELLATIDFESLCLSTGYNLEMAQDDSKALDVFDNLFSLKLSTEKANILLEFASSNDVEIGDVINILLAHYFCLELQCISSSNEIKVEVSNIITTSLFLKEWNNLDKSSQVDNDIIKLKNQNLISIRSHYLKNDLSGFITFYVGNKDSYRIIAKEKDDKLVLCSIFDRKQNYKNSYHVKRIKNSFSSIK